MSIVSSRELQTKFYVTKLYGEESSRWPRSTICLVKCNAYTSEATWECITGTDEEFDDWERFDNSVEESSKHHAETYMINYLNTKIFGESIDYIDVDIHILINYSPCFDCANKIVDMINNFERREIRHKIQICFANFYSCHGSKEQNKNNRHGLFNLLKKGVDLGVFSCLVWDKLLYNVLKVHPNRILDHVITSHKQTRSMREIRENVDRKCLECLKAKSRSDKHFMYAHEDILDQVFAKNNTTFKKGTHIIDYQTFVTEKGDEYIEKMTRIQSLLDDMQSLSLYQQLPRYC